MNRKSCLLLCMLSLSVFTAVGCGDDKSDSASTPAEPAATTEAAKPDSGDATTDAALQAAIDSCKASIDSNPAVKADIKAELTKICDNTTSGDPDATAEAAKQICLKLVEASGVPEVALDQAKEACNKQG